MIPKRLVFHFYAGGDWKESPVYKIHQYLLKRYSNIFTDALFVISVDDITDNVNINDAKHFLVDTGIKNIQFRIEENDSFCEVATFEKYVIKNLQNLDGMTFFAHSKGSTNIKNFKDNAIMIFMWIFALYYLSLEYYKEGEKYMFGTNSGCCFFGPLLGIYPEEEWRKDIYFPKNNAMYIGAFYWMNCNEIYNRFKDEIMPAHNRFYAENFPGNLCTPSNFELYSHDYMLLPSSLTSLSAYDADVLPTYVSAVLPKDEEYNNFMEEFGKMINNLNI